jgi:hypothetical protein
MNGGRTGPPVHRTLIGIGDWPIPHPKLATELERIAAANAILDEERENNFLGLLCGADDEFDSLAEIASVLKTTTSD